MGKTIIVTKEERAKIIDLYVNEYKAIHKIAEVFDFGVSCCKKSLIGRRGRAKKKNL